MAFILLMHFSDLTKVTLHRVSEKDDGLVSLIYTSPSRHPSISRKVVRPKKLFSSHRFGATAYLLTKSNL